MMQSLERKTADRACPVCGGKTVQRIHTLRMYLEDLGLPNQYDVVQCESCGMCYADTEAAETDYEHYYCDNNFYGGLPTATEAQKPHYKAIEALLEREAAPESRIMDTGFGDGGFLQYLRRSGFRNLSGLDPSPESVAALEKDGIQGICASLQADIPEQYRGGCDVVVNVAVMEHLYSPRKAVKAMTQLLAGDGLLVLYCPLFDDLSKHLLPPFDTVNQEHINYYSHLTLTRLVETEGYREIAYERVESVLPDGSVVYNALAAYRRCAAPRPAGDFEKDEATGRALRDFFKIAEGRNEAKYIEKLCVEKRPVAIWGVGAYLRACWAETMLPRCNIQRIVDGSARKQGTCFRGYEISPPEVLRDFTGVVLVTVMVHTDKIGQSLREMGFRGSALFLSCDPPRLEKFADGKEQRHG